MKEIFIDLQKAYERKKERLSINKKEWRKRIYQERKTKGICTNCGKKELTESEKKLGIVKCYSCRYKTRKKMKAD